VRASPPTDNNQYREVDQQQYRSNVQKVQMHPAKDDIGEEQRDAAGRAHEQCGSGAGGICAAPEQPAEEQRHDRPDGVREHRLQVLPQRTETFELRRIRRAGAAGRSPFPGSSSTSS